MVNCNGLARFKELRQQFSVKYGLHFTAPDLNHNSNFNSFMHVSCYTSYFSKWLVCCDVALRSNQAILKRSHFDWSLGGLQYINTMWTFSSSDKEAVHCFGSFLCSHPGGCSSGRRHALSALYHLVSLPFGDFIKPGTVQLRPLLSL